jgi:hypothetical protein
MLIEPQLRPELSPLSSINDLERFVFQYGDSYISSVALGGEFIGVFTFHSETRDQAERVEIELAAGGLVNGFNLGVELHNTLQQVKHASGTSYNFNYQVRGTHKPDLDPGSMVGYAQSFGSSGFDQPALLSMSALGYETVPEINMAFAAVANNRKLFTRSGGLMRQYQRIEELINQIEDIIESLRIYGIQLDDADELMTNLQTARSDLTVLDSLTNAYKTSPTSPLQIPSLPSLEIGSPRIVATVIEDPETQVGRMEAPNGDCFDFPFDASTAVQSRVRLSGIGLEAGWRVDKLLLRYQTRDEASEKYFAYGGSRGNQCGDKRLGVGESISAIFGEFGPTNIDKLRLINFDKWVLAGGGERGDKQHPVDWRRAPDQVVLGFTGRSNNNDDGAIFALQAVVARFERIDWEPIDPRELLDGEPDSDGGTARPELLSR